MNSKLVSLFCCLIMLVSFSGCTKVTQLVKDNQPKRNCSQKSTKSISVGKRLLPPTRHPICGITMTPLMHRNILITSPIPTANTMPKKN